MALVPIVAFLVGYISGGHIFGWKWPQVADNAMSIMNLVLVINTFLLLGAAALFRRSAGGTLSLPHLMFDFRGITRYTWATTALILPWTAVDQIRLVGSGRDATITISYVSGPRFEGDKPIKLSHYCTKRNADWAEARVRTALAVFSGGRYRENNDAGSPNGTE